MNFCFSSYCRNSSPVILTIYLAYSSLSGFTTNSLSLQNRSHANLEQRPLQNPLFSLSLSSSFPLPFPSTCTTPNTFLDSYNSTRTRELNLLLSLSLSLFFLLPPPPPHYPCSHQLYLISTSESCSLTLPLFSNPLRLIRAHQ